MSFVACNPLGGLMYSNSFPSNGGNNNAGESFRLLSGYSWFAGCVIGLLVSLWESKLTFSLGQISPCGAGKHCVLPPECLSNFLTIIRTVLISNKSLFVLHLQL